MLTNGNSIRLVQWKLLEIVLGWGWRGGSVVKGIRCSQTGPMHAFLHSHHAPELAQAHTHIDK